MVASFFKLLTTLLLALAVAAQPTEVVRRSSLVNVPIFKHVSTGPINVAKQDQLRVESLKAKPKVLRSRALAASSSPVTNQAVSYVASVGVGSPATQYNLIVDTGSSNTWVGANKAYVVTSTSQSTGNSVSVAYGSGGFNGTEYIDEVTITSSLVISKQSIGDASESTGFDGDVNGIIGVGPVGLTEGTLSPDTSATIPTVTDNLFADGTIPENVLAVSFEPITSSSGQQTNGELTWGGTDSTKYTGEITYTPITSTSPANLYWGIDASITYGKAGTTILSSTAGIVDTGTTLVLIASDAYAAYQSATGATLDSATGLLTVSSSQYGNLESLFVTVAGVTFELTANAQIWPRNLNSNIGGTANGIYLVVGDAGSKSGSGLDFLLGQTFLERFYSVYDTGNQRVGLATTSFTDATSN